MGMLVWVGFLAFFFASLVVGIRLILLWTRTRELPELLIGVGVLGIGPVGFGSQRVASVLLVNAQASDADGAIPASVMVLTLIGATSAVIGVACKLFFNTRVYHADSQLMARLMWAGVVGVIGLLVYRISIGDLLPTASPSVLAHVQSFAQIFVLLWGSAEALSYWRRMQRRTALGLADPAVTNRFLLWGIGAGAAGVGSLVGTVAALALGQANVQVGWVVVSSSMHGLVAAIALSLAFVPPPSYLRWVRRNVGGAQA
jgi:hypothetical protein